VLHPGDTLLVEAHPSFAEQHKNSRDFFLVSALDGSTPPRHERAFLSLVILALMVVGITLVDQFSDLITQYNLPFNNLLCVMLAAAAMVGTRCLSVETARKSIEWETLLAIASALVLGVALQKTGTAEYTARYLLQFSQDNPLIALSIIYFATLLATELITNNAAAALMIPFAISTANALEVSYVPFAIAVMMAASNGFATPIGYQTHLMVYGPGGYRFSDYLKIGVPLDILIGVVTIVLTPIFFPLVKLEKTVEPPAKSAIREVDAGPLAGTVLSRFHHQQRAVSVF
jgi:di/tricarboxylate transporter